MEKRGKHARPDDGESTSSIKNGSNYTVEQQAAFRKHRARSKKSRIALILVILVILALFGALGYGAWQLFSQSQQVGTEAVQTDDGDVTPDASGVNDSSKVENRISAPELTSIIGLSVDDALAVLGNDAQVESSDDIEQTSGSGKDEKTEVVGQNVKVSLRDQNADTRSTMLYLVTSSDGLITDAALSVSMDTLNFEYWNFEHAVTEEHVVEVLLNEVGLVVEEGSVSLPEDESEYRVYADDNETATQDQYAFSGNASDANGNSYMWSLRLSYDYTSSNVSGDSSNTIRQVYLDVTSNA